MSEQNMEKPDRRVGKQLVGLWSLHGATEDQTDEIANEIFEATRDFSANSDDTEAQNDSQ